MAFVEETKPTSSFLVDRDATGGVGITIVNSSGAVVDISVDALGVLSTAISSSTTKPDRFGLWGADGILYLLDTDTDLALNTVATDGNYNALAHTITAPTGEVFDLQVDVGGVLNTVLL